MALHFNEQARILGTVVSGIHMFYATHPKPQVSIENADAHVQDVMRRTLDIMKQKQLVKDKKQRTEEEAKELAKLREQERFADMCVINALLAKLLPKCYRKMVTGEWLHLQANQAQEQICHELALTRLTTFNKFSDFKILIGVKHYATFDEFVHGVISFGKRFEHAITKANKLALGEDSDVEPNDDYKPSGRPHLTPAQRRAEKQAAADRVAFAALIASSVKPVPAPVVAEEEPKQAPPAVEDNASVESVPDTQVEPVPSVADVFDQFQSDLATKQFLDDYERAREDERFQIALVEKDVVQVAERPMEIDATPAPTPLSQAPVADPLPPAVPMQVEEKKVEPAQEDEKEAPPQPKRKVPKAAKKIKETLADAPRRSTRERNVAPAVAAALGKKTKKGKGKVVLKFNHNGTGRE